MPTNFLSTQFCAILQDQVACQTMHSAFFIPVNVSEPPCVNWAILHFNIVIIDEISMISERNFQHILNTLNRLIFRHVLVLGGDNAQQQPFEKSKNMIVNIASLLTRKSFLSSVYQYTLSEQHRVGDTDYLAFLDHIRNWTPNDSLLQQVQERCVLCPDGILNSDRLIQAFQCHPDSSIITFTNEAAYKLNDLTASTAFANLTATPMLHQYTKE